VDQQLAGLAGTLRLIVAGMAVGALACSRISPGSPALEPAAHGHVVYVVSHGWHVGLAVRRADVSTTIWPESAELGAVRYLEVGWGDGDYYPAVRGNPGLALRAVFSSASSVLHVAGIDAPLTEFFDQSSIIEVPLSPRGFDELTRFIHAAYARAVAGIPIVVGHGIYGVSRFYRATGRYRLLDNSNHWTAKALAAAGCPIDPAETMTAGSLMHRAREFGRVLRPAREAVPRATCR
jgi:uncharacterized protein (TIGR02117 family)